MKKATYTTIIHDTLAQSGLTVQEFFVADIVDKLSNPYCTMLRDKLCGLVGISRQGLFKLLKKLETEGYIEISRKGLRSTEKWNLLINTNDDTSTKFTPHVNKVDIERKQSVHEVSTKFTSDVNKVYDSIYIRDNNKDKNKDNNNDTGEAVQKKEKTHPLGKTSLQRLTAVYCLMWLETFDVEYRPDWGKFGKAIQAILNLGYSEQQVGALIVTHFQWHGTTGDDDFAQKNLETNGYPIYWVGTKANEYMTYLKNVLEVDFDDGAATSKFVVDAIGEAHRIAVKRQYKFLPATPKEEVVHA